MLIQYVKEGNNLNFKLPSGSLQGDNTLFRFITNEINVPEDAHTILFDFTSVDYINSLGIAELISIFRYFQRRYSDEVEFKLVAVSPEVKKVLEIVEIDQFFDIESKN